MGFHWGGGIDFFGSSQQELTRSPRKAKEEEEEEEEEEGLGRVIWAQAPKNPKIRWIFGVPELGVVSNDFPFFLSVPPTRSNRIRSCSLAISFWIFVYKWVLTETA